MTVEVLEESKRPIGSGRRSHRADLQAGSTGPGGLCRKRKGVMARYNREG